MDILRFSGVLLSITFLMHGSSVAQQCPSQPDIAQVNHDFHAEVEANLTPLTKVKVGELKGKVDVVAKNLFDKYPNIDKAVIVQMMNATYCPLIRDSKTLKDSEKAQRITEFADRVFRYTNKDYAPPSSAKPKASPPSATATQPPPVKQDCGSAANCAMSSGQTGGFTGQVLIGPPQRKIPDDKKDALIGCLKKVKGKFQVSSVSDTNAWAYAQDWYNTFQAAEWTPDGTIRTFMIVSGIWTGVQVRFHGSYPPKTNPPYDLTTGTAEENAFNCLNGVVIGMAKPVPEFPSGLVSIEVGPPPTQ